MNQNHLLKLAIILQKRDFDQVFGDLLTLQRYISLLASPFQSEQHFERKDDPPTRAIVTQYNASVVRTITSKEFMQATVLYMWWDYNNTRCHITHTITHHCHISVILTKFANNKELSKKSYNWQLQ